ncbi:MinD/ParA family protein [Streptomyces sp. MRC013]|uniref:MinD/ParA family ATP-binding protein n=1 Tax=Streptomyces sp. MRC013 TaxID=2898276 RepID=UPI0020264148|nr:MinD/ParA family protein [Streptomyces sp. MRC013]URM91581.1 MinD/ParA family protein [Streptomyces sp. MRC013]
MPSGDNWQGDVLRDLRGAWGGAPAGGAPPQPTPGPDVQMPQVRSPTPGLPGDRLPGPVRGQASPQAGTDPAPATASGSAPGPAHSGVRDQPAAHPAVVGGSRPSQRPAPDSRPVIDENLASTARAPHRGESLTTRTARAVRRIVSSSTAREVAEATSAAEALQQPVTTGRQIAVTSIRGGAGKTTVAALLGTTYAYYRQDPVLLVEADPDLGSLPLRLGAEQLRWTTADVADIVEPQMSLLDVTGYLIQLPDNAWLLPGGQGRIGAMLDATTYGRTMVALRRYFGVTVVDCETLPAEVARVALSASQARVLTAPATLEGLSSTYTVLEWMRGLPPHIMAATVVVLTELAPHRGLDHRAAARKLSSTGASVHVLPYDRHLAAGGRLHTGLLAGPTRRAVTRIAADVLRLSQQRH